MFLGFCGVPSSLIMPVTVPAVAVSTGLPDGFAVAAGVSEVCSLPPQLIIATANAAAAANIHKDLLLMTYNSSYP
jgi:hypothetical protein